MLNGKTVILGVSGGIAAYKAAALCSALKQGGADVYVLMTEHAKEFVGAATFEALSGHRVITDTFESSEFLIPHIRLAHLADLFVAAPATANLIAKLACGIADDMLTSTFLACTCPKLIVPAMNVNMYDNPATVDNLALLKKRGITLLEPDTGHLAEGLSAKGKMPEPSVIYRQIEYMIGCKKDLSGKKIVITAGPTEEALDPVRFLTNHSSGKMGYALAKAAAQRGACVVLISGHVQEAGDGVENALLCGTGTGSSPEAVLMPAGVRRVRIRSAVQLAEAVKAESRGADCVIMAAAVADFTPAYPADEKLKKTQMQPETDESGQEIYTLRLKRTEDVLSWLGAHKEPGQVLVGFSMETRDLVENSRKKLREKHADLIVANNLKEPGAGFGTDTNIVTLIDQNGEKGLPILSKEETAHCVLDAAFGINGEN
ncbi:MAG: bifunctional phosphopantothenoylcysteine decarboxylase/phosphopantothenate--cysteine ligase CoaBC [Eubacteriales bacterium]|nr:bifunctional phosphopantothenoylcysteine decarboxylase/phosphopantothenate--cysteine ligase CoaBC [Eubacteriales bacterium]